jgi:hypothetical protein
VAAWRRDSQAGVEAGDIAAAPRDEPLVGVAGPLAEGDLFGYYVDNPVQVRGGTAVEIAFELVSKGRDVGNADGRPRPSGSCCPRGRIATRACLARYSRLLQM